MDYQGRINRVREQLQQRRLDGLLAPPDANMEYLTSVPRLSTGNTKQRQNSSEFSCVLITQEEAVIFLPQLHHLVTMTKLDGREAEARFVVFPDGDLTGKALLAWLGQKKLQRGHFGIAQDVTAPLALLLQQNGAVLSDESDILTRMRAVKDQEELRILEEASAITDRVYAQLLPQLRVGASVPELELEIERLIQKNGGSCSSFPGEINNHGPKAGRMVGCSHHTIEKGYVLGLDFGLVYQGYCTDFGRTVFVGEPTGESVRRYRAVQAAQRAALERMGDHKATCQELHLAASRVLEDAGYREAFLHKLGHGVGMDVHERPFLALGETQPLRRGMVFAVEPSIFRERESFIRLEDMAVVTREGYRILSKVSQELCVVE